MNKKGQVFSMDLAISLIAFLLIFTSVVIFMYSVTDSSNPYSTYSVEATSNYINTIANQAADSIASSQGVPSNWNATTCSKISMIGILLNGYYASSQKFYNLTTLPLTCLSQLVRGGGSFNFTASYLNNSVLIVRGTKISVGFTPPSTARYIASIYRFVVLYPGNNIVRLNFKEWLT